jgi:hypothetical protein
MCVRHASALSRLPGPASSRPEPGSPAPRSPAAACTCRGRDCLRPARVGASRRGLGRYGEQLQYLYTLFPREQVLVIRYRLLVDEPARTLDRICAFLGVAQGVLGQIPRQNVTSHPEATLAHRAVSLAQRAGSAAASRVPGLTGATLTGPLERYLQRHSRERQPLSWEQRRELLPRFEADIKLLEDVLGEDFRGWLRPRDRSGGMVGARPAGQGQARNGRPGQPLREPAAWRPSPSTKISMSSSKRSSASANANSSARLTMFGKLGWPARIWLVLAAGLAGLCTLGLLEARRSRRQSAGRQGKGFAPLLRVGLFRIPAFAAGLSVQLAFAAGMQGFFLAFALWLQAGEHFSPLKAGLTAVASASAASSPRRPRCRSPSATAGSSWPPARR